MSDHWLPVADALATIQHQIEPLHETETVPLQDALDRIIARPIHAEIDVPGYDNSAMDGYAVRAAEATIDAPLKIVGSALAGHPYAGELAPQSCVRITTGAQMPADCDAVIMQEQVERIDSAIRCQTNVHAGDNVRPQGSDIHKGAVILTQGQRLTPTHIGILASLGCAKIEVFRRLRVALFSNGDELVLPGEKLQADSQIYDSNRFTLHAMLQRLGAEVLDLGLIADNCDALEHAFRQAMRSADVIISSAGVSVGDADYTKEVMTKLGQIGFWKIAMKPGKPFAFGRLDQSWFCGLPGNPVAAVVTMVQIVQPMLRRLAGEHFSPPLQLQARASTSIKKKPGRMDFQRGHFNQRDGQLWAEPAGSQSSAVLTSVAQANCFLVLEQDRGTIDAEEIITIQPFDSLLT
ncbi:molybdopterin molybdotransferase MoeA [Pseudidiomarina sp. E22-M8]|uniref:molybdopterin molybdotransferase MoeA n=1 Tax=Pseudidiomarina sp. E22-M8 TaxID=3424768 RepID=UPI00403C6AF0